MSSKAAKESFVSGHGGTTVFELATVLVACSVGYTLRNVLLVRYPEFSRATRQSILLSFLLDFYSLVLPSVLVCTVLADYTLQVCILGLTASVTIAAHSIWRAPRGLGSVGDIRYTPTTLPFVTATRTLTNLVTAIAILAVDFPIFPRRFAKTETYGTGLMDTGVGMFVVIHGLTSPEARGKFDRSGYVRSLLGTGRRVLPLLVLGLARLASVKATDYQEHVTEYGAHWNFFFTIAVVRVLCTAVHPLLALLPLLPYASCAVFLASLHQLFLSQAGGTSYVILGPSGDGSRVGLLSANREGVVSCVGYLAMYMASIELGKWLFQHRKHIRDFIPVSVFLGVGVVLLWTLTSVCEVYLQRVSRRLANLPFMLWLFSQLYLVLLLFVVTDLLLLVLSHSLPLPSSLPSPLYTTSPPSPRDKSNPPSPPPLCLVSAIHYNQLPFFLLANLLTGLVNFSMDTLHTPAPVALCVMVVYMCVLVALCLGMHRYGIKLKL